MATAQTKFASAERAEASSLHQQAATLLDMELLDKLYGAVSEIILILNQQRQIVFCNSHFVDLLGQPKRYDLVGMRPGEALGCIHARDVAGCGTSESCSTCGAVTAILNAQQGKSDVKECRILRGMQGDAMDLLVRATPLNLQGEDYTIFAALDISHEKRRKALERIFFHDLMNTATAIRMLSSSLSQAGLGKISDLSSDISQGVEQLIEEIGAQRDLIHAESNDLLVRPVEMTSMTVLSQILDTYGSFAKMRGCELVMDPQAKNTVFCSDPKIVARVVGNMIKNALEACVEGQRVTVDSRPSNGGVTFSVHNPGYIPRDVQLQLFQRSFSTKGNGRGLGTYSMKLLTERYLKGSVAFSSSETAGTTFTVKL